MDSFTSWAHLCDEAALIKLSPALLATAWMWVTMKHAASPLALPLVLMAIPAIFHGARWAGGWSIADLQDAGWLLHGSVSQGLLGRCWLSFWHEHQLPVES